MKGYVFQGPGASSWEDVPDPVVEAGPDARTVRPGDRVLVSCTTARSRCLHCRKAMYGQCRGGGGWTLGRLIDGTQAEYVRVPFADLSVHPLPEALADQDAVLLADIFPLEGMEEAYDVFGRAAQTGALKVALGAQPPKDLAVPTV